MAEQVHRQLSVILYATGCWLESILVLAWRFHSWYQTNNPTPDLNYGAFSRDEVALNNPDPSIPCIAERDVKRPFIYYVIMVMSVNFRYASARTISAMKFKKKLKYLCKLLYAIVSRQHTEMSSDLYVTENGKICWYVMEVNRGMVSKGSHVLDVLMASLF